jgi:mono/diheme cytochrome c family protein
MKKIFALVPLAALAVTAIALAGEEKVKLKDGPGLEKVRNNCIACHSLDYIPLNSPFLDAKGWEATVTKMQKAYGAPVKPEDVAPIAQYLAENYGKK